VEISELAKALVALGCPAEKSAEMAAQLDKRAKQLAAVKNRSYDDALMHLLKLMQQGWAAQNTDRNWETEVGDRRRSSSKS
jgi:hypothetical protein